MEAQAIADVCPIYYISGREAINTLRLPPQVRFPTHILNRFISASVIDHHFTLPEYLVRFSEDTYPNLERLEFRSPWKHEDELGLALGLSLCLPFRSAVSMLKASAPELADTQDLRVELDNEFEEDELDEVELGLKSRDLTVQMKCSIRVPEGDLLKHANAVPEGWPVADCNIVARVVLLWDKNGVKLVKIEPALRKARKRAEGNELDDDSDIDCGSITPRHKRRRLQKGEDQAIDLHDSSGGEDGEDADRS